MPARPEGVSDEDIVRGLYRFKAAPATWPARTAKRSPCGQRSWPAARSCSRRCARRQLLAERGVAADVWSAPSYQLLRNEALEADRWNRLHPDEPQQTPLRDQPAARARRARPDRRGQRLHHGLAGHDRALGARRLVASRWARTASAAATRARRCAASSRSTPSRSRRPCSPSWPAAAESTRLTRASRSKAWASIRTSPSPCATDHSRSRGSGSGGAGFSVRRADSDGDGNRGGGRQHVDWQRRPGGHPAGGWHRAPVQRRARWTSTTACRRCI